MKTKEDVINALREVHFLERTAELSRKYKKDVTVDVKTARKDKVFAIISKLGYTPSKDGECFVINGLCDDDNKRAQFWFDKPWIKFAFYYYDEGEIILGFGPWWQIKCDVAGSDDYVSGSPAYRSYEDIEEIVSEAIEIYKDSMEALYKERQETTIAPLPDLSNIYHLSTTKQDVRDALKRINFVKRSYKLTDVFHYKARVVLPPIDKKKVFAIIEKLGFNPGHIQDFYYIKDQEIGPYRFRMDFTLKYAIVDFMWYLVEEGDVIYGHRWGCIEKDLDGLEKPRPGLPSFPNYDHLERILAVALQMLEDFKYEFLKSKGIEYERKDVTALEKKYLETEERDTRPLY